MPKTSIYVPDDLAELVRHYGLSVSEVAQAALREAVNESGRHFRRELAYVVLEHVKWREVVAGNYPDDPRNRQAVAALRALAEHILALEPDDSRLVHLRDSAEHARQLDSYVPETGEACGNWGARSAATASIRTARRRKDSASSPRPATRTTPSGPPWAVMSWRR